jgi:CheY-like chemotaxis protein
VARILVLDDDPNRLKAFRSILGIGNLLTTELENNEVFDYIFLDHDLGGEQFVNSDIGTGYEVAKWLSEHKDKIPSSPIIIHSLNGPAAWRMQSLLPNSQYHPFAWMYPNGKIEGIIQTN